LLNFPKPDVEQFFRTYLIATFDVSKDESKLIFSTNLNGKFDLWAMDLPHTYPYQLTATNQMSEFIKINPEKRHILTSFDNDGDENYQIYALPLSGGNPLPILTGEKEDKFFYGYLSKDGERLYYTTSKDNPSFLDNRLYNLKTKEDKLLLKGENALTFIVALSPSEESFVYTKIYSNTYQVAFLRTENQDKPLTPDPESVHHTSSPVFIDESTIYFLTDYDKDFSYLAKYDTHGFEPILEINNENITSLEYHQKSNTIYLTTETGVIDKLYKYNLNDNILIGIPLPTDIIEKLVIAESGTIYVLGRSATKPHNIFRSEGSSWIPLTSNRVLGIPETDLVEPEVVRYESFDGLEIEALLFKPHESNGYTIFWPHGGPQYAERKFFRAMFQVLLNRGYLIFAPNFRGSTGYGSKFTKMVEGDWGEGPRLDCLKGIEWLFNQGISSKDKLFVVGGSYGGYMTLLLAGRHPEIMKASVDIFGPSNLFTFINSVPEHWKPIMKLWLGDPVEDKEKLEKDSPITYLDNMSKPMLVIQGANDPRVVQEESDQIVQALENKGLEVEYLVLEDEGHGFSKKENEIRVYKLMLDFLAKHQ